MKYKYNELNNIIFTAELNPRLAIMKKNRIDHNGATGIWARPSGYTMKTKPGPATKSCAIKCLKVPFCICHIFLHCNDFVKRINGLSTRCSYVCYGGALGKRHEPQHRKNDETSIETREAVNNRDQKGVSEINK